MSKKSGIILVIMGAVLMLSALLLFIYNETQSLNAGQEAETLLVGIKSAISEVNEIQVQKTEGTNNTVEHSQEQMPKVAIDGYDCIGYIQIPELKLELPVISDWDYNSLKVAAGRHFGSSKTDDLVIAAHNYKTHFGSLSKLKTGDEILFTDMDGTENRYTLSAIKTLSADSVDAVKNSGYDLVLYTCTTGGKTRIVAFCDRVQTQS